MTWVSYIDSNRRLEEILGHVNSTKGLSSLINYLIQVPIVSEQKGSVQPFRICCIKLGYFVSLSCLYRGYDTIAVLEEFHDYTPQIPLAHIKLRGKPSVGRSIPPAKFLVDTARLVEEWLSW